MGEINGTLDDRRLVAVDLIARRGVGRAAILIDREPLERPAGWCRHVDVRSGVDLELADRLAGTCGLVGEYDRTRRAGQIALDERVPAIDVIGARRQGQSVTGVDT